MLLPSLQPAVLTLAFSSSATYLMRRTLGVVEIACSSKKFYIYGTSSFDRCLLLPIIGEEKGAPSMHVRTHGSAAGRYVEHIMHDGPR